jgi:hypothetical protein
MRKLLVLATPCAIATSPGHVVEREAFLEHVAEVEREPPRQRLQAEHAEQRAAPGSALRNWPASIATLICPDRLG